MAALYDTSELRQLEQRYICLRLSVCSYGAMNSYHTACFIKINISQLEFSGFEVLAAVIVESTVCIK
jgi:hypothetical protein